MTEPMIFERETNGRNVVRARGRILENPVFSHERMGIRFYRTKLSVYRLSSVTDTLPLLLAETLFRRSPALQDHICEVRGSFRSFNAISPGGRHLELSVFANELRILDGEEELISGEGLTLREKGFWETGDLNRIHLEGVIVKEPVLRRTPMGREISQLLLAVSRNYPKSDYIPCLCWGRNARRTQGLPVGTEMTLDGRIQSRLYIKKRDAGKGELRTTYEVSADSLRLPGDPVI